MAGNATPCITDHKHRLHREAHDYGQEIPQSLIQKNGKMLGNAIKQNLINY